MGSTILLCKEINIFPYIAAHAGLMQPHRLLVIESRYSEKRNGLISTSHHKFSSHAIIWTTGVMEVTPKMLINGYIKIISLIRHAHLTKPTVMIMELDALT